VQATAGSLAGTAAEACFAFAYFQVAERWAWPFAFATGTLAFAIAGVALQALSLSPLALLAIALAALTLALSVMPAQKARSVAAILPAWDIPARMVVATLLVLSVTASAPFIGARLSGLLAAFSIFASVLTVFAHHHQGGVAARQALRGLLMGLYGFLAFFVALGMLLPRTSIALAFLGAAIIAMVVQAISFELMRRAHKAA
jgi:hypothetical protein